VGYESTGSSKSKMSWDCFRIMLLEVIVAALLTLQESRAKQSSLYLSFKLQIGRLSIKLSRATNNPACLSLIKIHATNDIKHART
jgi:hypothetical protein